MEVAFFRLFFGTLVLLPLVLLAAFNFRVNMAQINGAVFWA
jgi:hypothetical protein